MTKSEGKMCTSVNLNKFICRFISESYFNNKHVISSNHINHHIYICEAAMYKFNTSHLQNEEQYWQDAKHVLI